MRNGLKMAKSMQGGGDREKRVTFRESEVRFLVCYGNVLNLVF